MNKVFIIFCCILFIGCNEKELPTEKYNQFNYHKSHSIENNELRVNLKNPIMCPIRIWLNNSNDTIQKLFDQINPIELSERSDSVVVLPDIEHFNDQISYNIFLGSPSKKINPTKIELPFPKNRQYRIIQGNNTNYTHNSDYSRYAIDFSLRTNDTISSASDGYVVGVIDQYKYGGKDKKWKSYGNFITVYDPGSGIFYQYVHLTHKGSFVKVGDSVKSGQPIGLSGKTGQTDIEHLHFNCLIPKEGKAGLKSYPVEFVEGYKGTELKKNDIVKK